MKKTFLTVLLILILTIAAAGCNVVKLPEEDSQESGASSGEVSLPELEALPQPLPDREEIPEEPLSTLEEQVVYSSDFLYFYSIYRDNVASQYGAFMDMNTFWEQEVDGVTMQQHLILEMLSMVREQAVFYQAAVSNGMELSQQELDDIESDIQTVLEDQFDGNEQDFLNAAYLTPTQMTRFLQRSNLISQYMDKAMEEIEITDAQIAEYYAVNRENLDQVTARHILIDCTDEMSEEEQAEAKAKAEDILSQIQGGADIGQLAAEHSTDPGSKNNNGEYTFGRGQMVPEFEEWAFSAQPGDQGVVKTDYGYHVMEKISHSDLEDVKEQVEQILRKQKFPEQYSYVYELAESPDWSLNQELLDRIVAASSL